MIIKNSKKIIMQSHEHNTLNFWWRAYANESERKNDIIIAAINLDWNKKKYLKSTKIALIYHEKLKKLIMIVKELIKRCENQRNAHNKLYRIYLNNQISLKVIRVIFSTLNLKKIITNINDNE